MGDNSRINSWAKWISYAWRKSSRHISTLWVAIIGGGVGGLSWRWGLRIMPITDNPYWATAGMATASAVLGVVIVFLVHLIYAPVHYRLEPYGGLSAFLRKKLGVQMWPILLMASGFFLFVVLFGAGVVMLVIQLSQQGTSASPMAVGAISAPIAHPKPDQPIAVLSFEQQQFSIDLRKFVIANLSDLWAKAFKVEARMLQTYNDSIGPNSPPAISMFFRTTSIFTVEKDYKNLIETAKTNIEHADYMNNTQQSVDKFLRNYGAFQEHIVKYQEATHVDPNIGGAIEQWLESDTRALLALRELKASAAAAPILQKLNDDVMASSNHKLDRFLPRPRPLELPHDQPASK